MSVLALTSAEILAGTDLVVALNGADDISGGDHGHAMGQGGGVLNCEC